jgi:hypothetical protein
VTGRPDLNDFETGALYRHDSTDEIVEYVGTATMPELHREDVGVFRFVETAAGMLIATQAGYDQGETFTRLGDAMADDIDLAGGLD